MTPNRPRGRQKNVTGTGKPIKRRGSGLGTGPVGGADRGQGIGGGTPRPSGGFNPTPRPQRSYGSGGGGFSKLIILVLLLLFGGGGGLTAMLGGGSDVPGVGAGLPQGAGTAGRGLEPGAGAYRPRPEMEQRRPWPLERDTTPAARARGLGA